MRGFHSRAEIIKPLANQVQAIGALTCKHGFESTTSQANYLSVVEMRFHVPVHTFD